MIRGIGIDLVEKDRMAQIVDRYGDRFVNRILTKKEKDQCEKKGDRIGSISARFAAKEAFFKAMGTGWMAGTSWKDIEVNTTALGKPELILYGPLKGMIGSSRIHISLTHERGTAAAFVVIEDY